MGKKVSDLVIKPQTGNSGTYYASWDFVEPTIITTVNLVGGSHVRIKGSRYYNGVLIPNDIKSDVWIVDQVFEDRVVLGRNVSGSRHLSASISIRDVALNSDSGGAGQGTGAVMVAIANVDHYKVHWHYATGDGAWFDGGTSDVQKKNATYSPPANAKKIKVSVTPKSKTHKVNKKNVPYWTGTVRTVVYDISNAPPETPPTPKVEIDKLKLTASIDNISDPRTDQVEFKIYKGNNTFKTGIATVRTGRVSFSCNVENGSDYRVKCRAINVVGNSKEYSGWSEYSESKGTIPETPSGFIKVCARSETEVYLNWNNVGNVKQYEIQYTYEKRYFDSSSSEVKSTTVDGTLVGHADITGLETGKEWFFRVRAINDAGTSGWTEIISVILGKAPSAPTTWSSTTTAIVGEPLTLYWMHNSEDNSSQTYAKIRISIDDGAEVETTIENTASDKDQNGSYAVDTSQYSEGAKLNWRVKTRGVTPEYGPWSAKRCVYIYSKPTLAVNLTDVKGNEIEKITSFPFYLKGSSGPSTQKPIGYNVTVASNERYETLDYVGNKKIVNKGETIYSKYIDTTGDLSIEFLPSNIDLENGVSYTITSTVSMNSGLTADSTLNFTVSWVDDLYEPDTGISIYPDDVSVFLTPFCTKPNGDEGELVDNVLLSVYRREYDGTFTEIMTGLPNNMSYSVLDPHPALNIARYRIVATSKTTGAVSYYDPPGYPIYEKSVIMQWDEQWSNFNKNSEDEQEDPPWSGSILKIPYNIDVSNDYKPDVTLAEYVGRENPVSYYGTQRGETATWSVEFPKDDVDTLYTLRRLSRYMGNVYVREPSGSGYWANVVVSFSQTHCKVTIPVTFTITRVEGGM